MSNQAILEATEHAINLASSDDPGRRIHGRLTRDILIPFSEALVDDLFRRKEVDPFTILAKYSEAVGRLLLTLVATQAGPGPFEPDADTRDSFNALIIATLSTIYGFPNIPPNFILSPSDLSTLAKLSAAYREDMK